MKDNLKRIVPGFMVLKSDEGEKLLERFGWTPRDFAENLGISMAESYKLLSGERVGRYTARSFVLYFKAHFVHERIDWSAMGIKNPYPHIGKVIVRERTLRLDNNKKCKSY